MHTEYDTRTVANTLALYGVKRRPRSYWTWYAIGAVIGTVLGTVTGHLIRCVMGW